MTPQVQVRPLCAPQPGNSDDDDSVHNSDNNAFTAPSPVRSPERVLELVPGTSRGIAGTPNPQFSADRSGKPRDLRPASFACTNDGDVSRKVHVVMSDNQELIWNVICHHWKTFDSDTMLPDYASSVKSTVPKAPPSSSWDAAPIHPPLLASHSPVMSQSGHLAKADSQPMTSLSSLRQPSMWVMQPALVSQPGPLVMSP